MKPDINSVKVHPQLSHNGHPMDGAIEGTGPVWPAYSGFKKNPYNSCSDPIVTQGMLMVILLLNSFHYFGN